MLHFSPRYGRPARQVVRQAAGKLLPANDNAANDTVFAGPDAAHEPDKVLAAALRLFAAHGLSAAAQSVHLAECAAQRGDAAATGWWLAVCRTLDRRLAHDLALRQARGTWPGMDPARAS